MDVDDINLFLIVSEHSSLRRSAEAARLSQPTLSRRIAALEQSYGTPLFIRHGRGMDLTPAGHVLRTRLVPLRRHLAAIRDEVAAAALQPGGEVSLGLPPSLRVLLARRIATSFCRRYPNVTLRITEDTSGEVRDLVALGQLDVAITNALEPLGGLNTQPLASEPMLLVGPRSAGLELGSTVPISALIELPLLLTRSPNSLRQMVETGLRRAGANPLVRLEANTLPLMTDLVELGLGHTVLPSCGALPAVAEGRVSAARLEGMSVSWLLVRTRDRPLGVAARALVEVIEEEVRASLRDGDWLLATRA
jgi:LysR family nitrogen assimilation transcriptional regulator